MVSTATTPPRTIRVHGSELSTDGEMFAPYAETAAMLLALVSVLAAAWAVMTPSPDADLMVVQPRPTASAPTTAAPTGDLVQPNVAGPQTTLATTAAGPAALAGLAS